MERMHFLKTGAWMLLAGGAYVAGRWQDHPSGTAVTAGGVSSGVHMRAGTLPSAASRGDPPAGVLGWLESYQEKGGTILAERMEEAVRNALRNPDPVKATLYFAHLLEKLTAENAGAFLKGIHENAKGAEELRFISLLAHAWGALDGAGALAGLQSLKRRDLDGAVGTAMAAWASQDPEAAKRWLTQPEQKGIPGRELRREEALATGLVSGLARKDPGAALDYVMTFKKEEKRAELAHVLAEHVMREGVAKGANWAMGLPEEGMRTNALETIGYQYIKEDLPAAIQWAGKIADRPDAHEAVADVANEYANVNGREAAAWAAALPAGESRNHALEDVYETWTRADPLGASESLNGMEKGPGRDAAIEAFSRTLAKENPMDAVTWAGAISDSKERIDVQVEIARRWQASSPVEAMKWITSHFPEEAQMRAAAPRR